MGVTIDKDYRMTDHVKKTCEKANKTIAALSRILPNVRGCSDKKRTVITMVVSSIMLFGAPIWCHVLRKPVDTI